jgi:hypothetical protein
MTPTNTILPTCIFCGVACRVGYGFCHCGCGGKTNNCTMTNRKFGVVRGKPCRYILGHQYRKRLPIENAVPFKVDGVYCRLVPLSRGLHAIVNAEDYGWLMKWKWFAKWDKKGNCFYAQRHDVRVKGIGRSISMHREIIAMSMDDPRQADHQNGITLDNRRANLRPATCFENQRNSRKPSTNTSGYKGVSFHKVTGKWVAQIMVSGTKIHLGLFSSPELAYAAYCAAALKYHGDFARFR